MILRITPAYLRALPPRLHVAVLDWILEQGLDPSNVHAIELYTTSQVAIIETAARDENGKMYAVGDFLAVEYHAVDRSDFPAMTIVDLDSNQAVG